MNTRAPSTKRSRSSIQQSINYDSDHSDGSSTYTASRSAPSARSSGGQGRPKKRFIWPEELHRDFIAAVFDVGLKTADAKALTAMLPENETHSGSGAVTQLAVKSALQKMRSFRYQMRKAVGGDSLETQQELARRDGLGLDPQLHSSDSAHSVTLLQQSASVLSQLACGRMEAPGGIGSSSSRSAALLGGGSASSSSRDVLQIPEEVQRVIDKLDGGALRCNVELVAQSVQIQRSVQIALAKSIANQRRLQDIMMQKVSELGMPYTSTDAAAADSAAAAAATAGSNSNGDGIHAHSAAIGSFSGLTGFSSDDEGEHSYSYLGNGSGNYSSSQRPSLPPRLTQQPRNSRLRNRTLEGSSFDRSLPPPLFSSGIGHTGGFEAALLSSSSPALHDSGVHSSSAAAAANPVGVPMSALPAELQLKMEMRGHMDMHRQMLLRQQGQLQLHSSSSGTAGAAAGAAPTGDHSLTGGAPLLHAAGAASDSGAGGGTAAASAAPASGSAIGVASTATAAARAGNDERLLSGERSSSDVKGSPDQGYLLFPPAPPPPLPVPLPVPFSSSGSSDAAAGSAAAAATVDAAGASLLSAPDWTWDEDILDEQLFNFLMET